ncbi:phosphatases II [Thozetella sp. PMI_491]|nr:phosphatases II [Thozetella sp. PMI_491]
MPHFQRFRRKKDDATTAPATPRPNSEASGNTSSPAGELQPAASISRGPRLSPLHHVFHRSGKRSRDSPATEQGILPAAHDGDVNRLPTPAPPKDEGDREVKRLTMPAFLELSHQEINHKFGELMWHENHRINLARQNPSLDFRWARVPPGYPRGLDRYINIQPWNNNRVKLRVPEGYVDYVNASPIVLTSSARRAARDASQELDRYIAMQGPKQQSTNHVWRMVVEQLESPGVIVMLTETHEGGQEKCWPYFPFSEKDPPLEINEHDEFGDGFRATVTCEGLEETVAGDAIELRKLVIRVYSRSKPACEPAELVPDMARESDAKGCGNGAMTPERTPEEDTDIKMKSPTADTTSGIARVVGVSSHATPESPDDHLNTALDGQDAYEQIEERIVWHFLYKKWPDFGVPDLDDLESFFTLMRLSREKNGSRQNPRIIHCSAGVGRSGTFIALEHLMRELEAGELEHYDTESPAKRSSDHKRGDRAAMPPRDDEGDDIIYSTVNQLREQRCTMVQSPAQYQFIYQVMRKLWRDKYGEEEADEPAAKRLEVDPFVDE